MAKQKTEARVIQKVATEQEWLQDDLILYKGEIALVSSGDNVVNIKVGDGIHTFAELEYMYRGGFNGSINPTTTTSTLTNGFYFAETSGTYTNANNIEVAEGYYTILEKNDNGWKIASSVKMPSVDLTEIEDRLDKLDLTYEEKVTKSDNLLDPDFIIPNMVVGSTGNVTTSSAYTNAITIKFPVTDYIGKPITVSGYTTNAGKYTIFKNSANATVGNQSNLNTHPRTFTPPVGAEFLYLYVRLNSDSTPLPNIMINEGTEALPYTAYFEPTTEIIGVKEIGGNVLFADSLVVGNEIPQSNNPLGAVNRAEMETYVAENSGSGEAYDQQLNTTDNVVFNSVNASQITTSVLVANLPTNINDVDSGEVWIDTTNGNTLKVK